jgi:hypothetical protein
MASESLPAIIAESDIRGPISALRQQLADAGCQIELLESTPGAGPKQRLFLLKKRFDSLKPTERYAAIAVAALFCFALVLLIAVGLGSNKEIAPAATVESAVKTSSTSTVTAGTSVSPNKLIVKKKPYSDFVKALPKLDLSCEQSPTPMNCLLNAFHSLSKTASVTTATLKPNSKVSYQEYTKVLHHRFFLCLAQEQSRPREGDQELVTQKLESMAHPLSYRYGRPACHRDRSNMYECVKQARKVSCTQLIQHIQGALIEYLNQKPVPPWTGRFADHYANKVLDCLAEKQKRYIRPLERARLHLFRHELALAVGSVENTCQEREYVSCARALHDIDCDKFASFLFTDSARVVREITLDCGVLEECR